MLRDFILQTTNSPGASANCNLIAAASGRLNFSQKFSNGANCFYFLDDGTIAEWGIGTLTTGAPDTFSRDQVIGNTANTTSRLNFTGLTRIYNEVPGENSLYQDKLGAVTINEPANGIGTLTVSAASGINGANIKLVGNGVTTPAKTIRVIAGSLQVVNHAYTAAIAILDDTGNLTITGGLTSSGPFTATSITSKPTSGGRVALYPGDTGHTGYLAFYSPTNVRSGYIGFVAGTGTTPNTINFVTENTGTGFNFNNNIISTANGITSTGLDATNLGGQFRAVNGNYGAMLRNDGTNCYLLSTASGNQYGSYNSYRPFFWNLTTGAVSIDITGTGTAFGGSITAANAITAAGAMTANGVLTANASVTVHGAVNIGASTAGSYVANNNLVVGDTAWINNNLVVTNGIAAKSAALSQGITAQSITTTGAVIAGTYATVGTTLNVGTTIQSGSVINAGGSIAAGNITGGGFLTKNGPLGGYGDTFNVWFNGVLYMFIGSTPIGVLTSGSDGNFKHKVRSLAHGALDRIAALRPVTYSWQDKGIFKDDGVVREGLIAQEVAEVIPSAYQAPLNEHGKASLDTLPIISVLIKGLQEAAHAISELQKRIAALEANAA